MVKLSIDNGESQQDKKSVWETLGQGMGKTVKTGIKAGLTTAVPGFNQLWGGNKKTKVMKPKSKPQGAGNQTAAAMDLLRYGPNGQKPGNQSMVPQQPSDLEKLISELQRETEEGFTWKGQAEEQRMIDEIFGSQLSQIANARNQTNSRYQESTANTRNLYQGHEDEIRGADRAIYQGIADGTRTQTNTTFDSGIKSMQDTQNQNRSASEEMMSRLGLQASAPLATETANEQQNAIDSLTAAKVSAQTQNDAYAASDLRRNDARAQFVADESVSKQADLTKQLQDILGDLGNKEADVNAAKSEAMYGAYQGAQDNWRSDREYATSALAQFMEAQGSASSASEQSMNAPAMSNVLQSLGINDPSLQEQYSSAYTDAVMNAKYYPGQQDQSSVYLNYIRKNNPELDPNTLLGLVQGNLSYGTYKPGTMS